MEIHPGIMISKLRSPPSLIVLMDLLFILVFVAMLREKKETYEIFFTPPLNFENIAVRYKFRNNYRWYLNKSFDYDDFSVGYKCDDKFRELIDIQGKSECTVYFHGTLGTSIAQAVFQACSAAKCGKLIIPISNEVTINKKEMLRLNPQLAKNLFFK